MNSEERKEQELADQTIELMESDGLSVADGDAAMTYELGHRLRELADDDSIECEHELRTQLMAQFGDELSTPASVDAATSAAPRSSSGWNRMWIVAASLLLLGVLAAMLLPPVQKVREAAWRPVATDFELSSEEWEASVASVQGKQKLPPAFYSKDDVQYAIAPLAVETTASHDRRTEVFAGQRLVQVDDGKSNSLPASSPIESSKTFPKSKEWREEKVRRHKYKFESPTPGRSGGGGRTQLGLDESQVVGQQGETGKPYFFESKNGRELGYVGGDGDVVLEDSQSPVRGHNLLDDLDSDGVTEGMQFGLPNPPSSDGRAIRQAREDLGRTKDLLTKVHSKIVAIEPTMRLDGSRRRGQGQDERDQYVLRLKDEYLELRDRYQKQQEYFFRFEEQSGRSSEQYEPIQENEFVAAMGGEAISTFSIDVDTASYSNVRRFINEGRLPPPNAVRLEELINYFDYEYDQPKGDQPFSVDMEVAGCPWNNGHQLLRIGLQGKDVHVNERPATNVVFLIDVSGSMQDQNKLPLLKHGFQLMVEQLNENDRVSIVTYAGNAGVVLEPTSGEKTRTINEAIEKLSAGGSTHGSAGIQLAYELAQKNFIQDGVNKVILATDGDLNVGVTNDDALVQLIKQKASENVFLTVLGFGTGNLKDGKLEKLADHGNGLYAYIDSLREAQKVLVKQMSGSLVTIAKDVKIQIEFNPAEVKAYRLLGYENRKLATEDFDNDRKDAGEIGAGHSVTAIYEIVPVAANAAAVVSIPKGLKYQTVAPEAAKPEAVNQAVNLSAAAKSGELATLALRFKKPDANESQRIEFAIKNEDKSFSAASSDFRFATSVAGFGMLLRGSVYSGDATVATIQEIATNAIGDDSSGYRAEFVDLLRKAATLSLER